MQNHRLSLGQSFQDLTLAVVALTDPDVLLAGPAVVDPEYRPILSASEECAGRHLQHRALAPDDDADLDAERVSELRGLDLVSEVHDHVDSLFFHAECRDLHEA